MFDKTHIGWLLSDDYQIAADLPRQPDTTTNPDHPDPADRQPRWPGRRGER